MSLVFIFIHIHVLTTIVQIHLITSLFSSCGSFDQSLKHSLDLSTGSESMIATIHLEKHVTNGCDFVFVPLNISCQIKAIINGNSYKVSDLG